MPPVAPRVSPPDLPGELAPARAARSAGLLASRVELRGTAGLAHSDLEQCVLEIDADTADLTGSTLLDVSIPHVRAASLSLRETSIRRLRIVGGRIGTLDLSGSRIDELELRDLRIDYLSLAGARAADVLFSECGIRALDLPQAQLTRVRFDGCRSDEVDTRGLRASDVDLRGLDAISFLDTNGLRGTTLTSLQVQLLAPVFAASAGIDVED